MSYYTEHGEILYQIRLNVTNEFTIDENLTSLLDIHEASLICQYDAFVNFVKECESKDDTDNALYRWTKETINDENKKNVELARAYMGIKDESQLSDLIFDKVFIGSCTNSRIEDLRQAAEIVKGKTIADNISEAIVVPGSGLVKEQAENEGLDKVFVDAGFIWRDPGCSMCLGMNPDQLKPHERCASTSNRNFEGRQGYLGRTHLMSPVMAAFTAINGTVGDPS